MHWSFFPRKIPAIFIVKWIRRQRFLRRFDRRVVTVHNSQRSKSKLNLLHEIPSSYFHKIECVSVRSHFSTGRRNDWTQTACITRVNNLFMVIILVKQQTFTFQGSPDVSTREGVAFVVPFKSPSHPATATRLLSNSRIYPNRKLNDDNNVLWARWRRNGNKKY